MRYENVSVASATVIIAWLLTFLVCFSCHVYICACRVYVLEQLKVQALGTTVQHIHVLYILRMILHADYTVRRVQRR